MEQAEEEARAALERDGAGVQGEPTGLAPDITEVEVFGPGRPGKRPAILGTRSLSKAELASLQQGSAPAVKQLRDSHHMVARLCALGLRTGDVAFRTGFSIIRISTLRKDPAFAQLVEQYRQDVDEAWKEAADEYFETVISNRITSARLIRDKLEAADPDDVTFGQLVAIHSDSADRTGYPKRSVAVNVNVDFAAQLDRAIARSAKALPESPPPAIPPPDPPNGRQTEQGGELVPSLLPAPLRRRA